MGVEVAVTAERTGELAIDVEDDAGFGGAGTGIVARKDAGDGGGDNEGFTLIEEMQRDANSPAIPGVDAHGFAIEREDEGAADGGGGQG